MAALVLTAPMLTVSAQAAKAEAPGNWWFYVHNDRPADLRALLAQGADPNVRFTNGQPAIMRAVVDGAWGVFDVLAANPRTDVNIENPAGETPLMYLAVAGQTERAKALIARGAQVNRLGWTPLHYAASKGQVDTARLLLNKGALVNAPSSEGRTPLMMAAYSGNRDMVQLLLDAGADPTSRDLKDQSAADWAQAGKWGALSEELQRVADSAWRKREAQRGQPSREPAAAVAPAPTPAVPLPPPASNTVQGVSGLRLNGYD
ncbi:ankyrin repeat domain-containing protein [Bordetella avium]|nr:hypothetical protein C0J09_08255 [Bordetella avium]AZY52497.1 hypothetical protein C0J07_08240 [Bordetella avium]RIQ12369.1 ankyrin repeat domain-containing protein [Bordetella avium]RIQ19444.1 ankyrin repeat domain-containing protein [Bordetella avium]RIQ33507.1 ankyrin repeat domain-containing protein [Bordetella avium]